VYIYEFNGVDWTETQIIVPSNLKLKSHFGWAMSYIKGFLFITAPAINTTSGLVYAYTKIDGSWKLYQTLISSNVRGTNGFGSSISSSENILAIGEYYSGSTGIIHIFEFVNLQWVEKQSIITGSLYFKNSIVITNDFMLVGTKENFATLYKKEDTKWVQATKIPYNTLNKHIPIAMHDRLAFVGGNLYYYNITTWTLLEKNLLPEEGITASIIHNIVLVNSQVSSFVYTITLPHTQLANKILQIDYHNNKEQKIHPNNSIFTSNTVLGACIGVFVGIFIFGVTLMACCVSKKENVPVFEVPEEMVTPQPKTAEIKLTIPDSGTMKKLRAI